MSDTAYTVFQHYGTNAQRLAFTPSPPATGQPIYVWYETDTGATYLYDTSWHQITGSGGGVTASGTLTANRLIIGGGSSVVAALGSLGTTTTLLHGNAAGAPTFAAVDLANDVSGNLATSHLNSGTSASIGTLWRGDGTWASIPYLCYQDQETQNTAGGTFTSGAWQTRVLNTEVTDTDNLGTLSSNQITLSAGTYRIYATAPAYGTDRHQARLQNVTDTSTVLTGMSCYTAHNGGAGQAVTTAIVQGRFTIAASKALELQHRCQTTESSDGFGVAANFTTEVYSVVELWRVG